MIIDQGLGMIRYRWSYKIKQQCTSVDFDCPWLPPKACNAHDFLSERLKPLVYVILTIVFFHFFFLFGSWLCKQLMIRQLGTWGHVGISD